MLPANSQNQPEGKVKRVQSPRALLCITFTILLFFSYESLILLKNLLKNSKIVNFMQSKARGDCTLLILPSGWFCELAGKGKCVQCAGARILKFLCGGKN